MRTEDLIKRFSDGPAKQRKAIFSTLFIATNRLQTLFDSHIPEVSLKQFMLLTLVRQSDDDLTLTELGDLLGCSRQNIKKLAKALEKKGFVKIETNPADKRASVLRGTPKVEEFFGAEFAQHEHELEYLFEIYSEEELATLFHLLSRLYAGIENLKGKVGNEHSSTD